MRARWSPAERSAVLARLAGRRVVASVSGGKDSAALSLLLKENEIEHDRLFLDTEFEAKVHYEYLRGELTRVLGPIAETRAALTFDALAVKKGMFLKAWISAKQDAGVDVVSAVGIRREESKARSEVEEWEWSDGLDCEVWRPLAMWTAADVVEIHSRHGLRPNPLYLLGAERVGCWPCIYARKSEVRLVAEVDPERIDYLRNLDARVTAATAEMVAAKGQALQHQRTLFQSGVPTGTKVVDGVSVPVYAPMPIDEAVTWARTSRGGKQFEFLAGAGREPGCARWGLCDVQADEDGP